MQTIRSRRAQHELGRYQAQYNALHLQYTRLNGVFESQPGIVAQQEVDDAHGKDLAASSQVDAGQAALEAAQSQLAVAKAKLVHDQSLFDYSRITAPFPGVVTERYANLGTLMQAGTGSSTQAMPMVRLSQDDLFRLVIPVPESYVAIHPNRRPGGCSRPRARTVRFPARWRASQWTCAPTPAPCIPKWMFPIRSEFWFRACTPTPNFRSTKATNVPTVPVQALSHEGDKTTVFVVNAKR